MRGPGSPPGLLFRLVVPATALFILTIFSLIAILFSDERAPVAQWLNRHGNSLLLMELIAICLLSVLAMAVDRWKTLRMMSSESTIKTEAVSEQPISLNSIEAAAEADAASGDQR